MPGDIEKSHCVHRKDQVIDLGGECLQECQQHHRPHPSPHPSLLPSFLSQLSEDTQPGSDKEGRRTLQRPAGPRPSVFATQRPHGGSSGIAHPHHQDTGQGQGGRAIWGKEKGEPERKGAGEKKVEVGDNQRAHIAVVEEVLVVSVDRPAEEEGSSSEAQVFKKEEEGKGEGVCEGEEEGLVEGGEGEEGGGQCMEGLASEDSGEGESTGERDDGAGKGEEGKRPEGEKREVGRLGEEEGEKPAEGVRVGGEEESQPGEKEEEEDDSEEGEEGEGGKGGGEVGGEGGREGRNRGHALTAWSGARACDGLPTALQPLERALSPCGPPLLPVLRRLASLLRPGRVLRAPAPWARRRQQCGAKQRQDNGAGR